MFLYLHDGIMWGKPCCVYYSAYEKLTDAEVAKLPPSDQFTGHRIECRDENGVPEMLAVRFDVSNVGHRFFLSRCDGVSLENLAREENVLAILMGKHPRLGENSPLGKLDLVSIMQVVERTFSE